MCNCVYTIVYDDMCIHNCMCIFIRVPARTCSDLTVPVRPGVVGVYCCVCVIVYTQLCMMICVYTIVYVYIYTGTCPDLLGLNEPRKAGCGGLCMVVYV